MVGKTIIIFLKSPLFRCKIKREDKTVELPRDIVQLKGEVVKEKGAGLWIRVVAMGSDDLSIDKDLPFSEIFLPYAKMDFFIFQASA